MSLKNKKLFLLDMDGTVYEGGRLFKGVNEFLGYIESSGGQYIFITNNSSRSVKDYVKKLSDMGVRVTEKNFFTSVQATALYLKEHFDGKRIFCMGTSSMVEELRNSGVNAVTSTSGKIDCVLAGYDTELTYQKLRDICYLLHENRDIPYIATNPDRGCPTEYGLVPDCFAICEAVNYAVGRRPLYIGKPDRFMIDCAVNMSPFKREQALVIGDRLYTDVETGLKSGMLSILVMSGETTPEMLAAYPHKPDLVFDRLAEMIPLL